MLAELKTKLIMEYNPDLFTSMCDKIANIADSSNEAKDALLRVAAQIIYDSFGDEDLAHEVTSYISEECKNITE
jgi:hypothetical protein